jgi:hypothetical protein
MVAARSRYARASLPLVSSPSRFLSLVIPSKDRFLFFFLRWKKMDRDYSSSMFSSCPNADIRAFEGRCSVESSSGGSEGGW